MTFKATLAGIKKAKSSIKYDRIEIVPNHVRLWNKDTVVAQMLMPKVDLGAGDTLTLTGLKGKLEVEVVE